MGDQDDKAPGAPSANRTIQIDALSDVELVDHEAADEGSDAAESPHVSRAPPPLPRKQQRSTLRSLGLGLVAVVTGVICALGIVHFLFPPPAPAPQTVVAAPPAAPAPPPAAVRHVHMDDEFVIHAADPGDD